MRILDAEWHALVNLYIIKCDCGHLIRHKANVWRVRCKKCNKSEHLMDLRDPKRILANG